jgi:hypothetical protein
MKVVTIPKQGKDLRLPKSYHPITLANFLLKGLEKLVLWFLQDRNLVDCGKNQYAFTQGKGCNDALSRVVTELEKGKEKGAATIAVSLDASGAFDRLTFGAAGRAMSKAGLPSYLVGWYDHLLRCRSLQLGSKKGSPVSGTPQGGILLPLIWNLSIKKLVTASCPKDTTITGYADDILITATGRNVRHLGQRTNRLLQKAEDWAAEAGISFNPQKTEAILVTNKRKISEPTLILGGERISYGNSLTYLGVEIDRHLRFQSHVINKIKKATALLYHCRQMIGNGWGLTPKRIWWVYQAIVRPTIGHGCVVWAHVLSSQQMRKRCASLQRKALIAMSGAMRGTPTAGMEAALGIPPLHLWIQKDALSATSKLSRMEGNEIGHLKWAQPRSRVRLFYLCLTIVHVQSSPPPSHHCPARRAGCITSTPMVPKWTETPALPGASHADCKRWRIARSTWAGLPPFSRRRRWPS